MTVEPVPESIGSFGTARDVETVDKTFLWYGTTVRVNPYVSELDLIEFLGSAADKDENDLAVVPALTTFLKAMVHPGDWSTFWNLARRNHASMIEDMLPLAYTVIEATTGRPTSRSSASTPGRPSTPESSTPGSSSPVIERALRLVPPGRGDLASFVTDAQGITSPDAATG